MAVPLDVNTTETGINIPGVASPGLIEEISDFEKSLARNLRQPSACGREWIRRLIDDPSEDAEMQLAGLVADSGGRALRENEAGLKAQLQAAHDRAEMYRRAVETLAGNAHFAPANYPPELRQILTAALGRPY